MTTSSKSKTSNTSATVKTIPVKAKAPSSLVELAQAIEREAAHLGESDTKAGEFVTGTAILGLANRAAFQVQSLTEKMDAAKRLAQLIVEDMGVTKGANELTKQRDNYAWAMTQRPTYEAIYRHCESAWTALKGTRMPDQHPAKSKVRASADEIQEWLAS